MAMHFAGLTRVDKSIKYPEKYQLHNFEKSKIFFPHAQKTILKILYFLQVLEFMGIVILII